MEKKMGVYICTGCDIGNSLDIERLSKVPTEEYKIPVCKTHAFFCGEEGLEIIKKDIEKEGVNTVLIAACSPRVNWDVFNFGPSVITERVNIREMVAWSHPKGEEATQELGEDYLRMGIARAEKVGIPEGYTTEEEYTKTILVVGGGIAGMTAALEAARANYKVVLVEKQEKLGGWAAKWVKQFPKHPPYQMLEDTGVAAKIKDVEANANIEVYTSTTVKKAKGQPGGYSVILSQNGKEEEIKFGSIIVASGWKPYDANKLEHFGYGKYPNVITDIMMEEMATSAKITCPSDGRSAESVAFISQSQDEEHLRYCSPVYSLVSLKQALYVRERNPEAKVYIFYKDMRTPGQYEIFYKKVQDDDNVFLTKGDVVGVTEDGDKNLIIEVDNTLFGEKIKVKADLVILPSGMLSTQEGLPNTVEEVYARYGLTGEEEVAKIKEVMASTPQPWEGVLNLDYRQGPEMPFLTASNLTKICDFPESNFICFPYESRRTGIYIAGCVRKPMDMDETITDATGAALKAIQCMELESRGRAVHPRAMDLSYPEFLLIRCTQCKRCTIECPFSALEEDEKGTPLPNLFRCRRCGICMGACPERIIGFKDYSVDIISSMLKAINVPYEDEPKFRILCFACENDAIPALDMAGINRTTYDASIRVIPVRCLGSMNLVFISDALSRGIDGILLLGCVLGDDYQCHFVRGSELAQYRLSKVGETLQRLALEPERVHMEQVMITDYHKLPKMINEFIEKIKEMGPNPFKGF